MAAVLLVILVFLRSLKQKTQANNRDLHWNEEMTTIRLFEHFLGGNQTTFHASKQIDEKEKSIYSS